MNTLTVPAMKANMGKRQYFSTTVSLSEIPRLFTFNDVPEMSPEQRNQRTLNKGRITPISNYILENEDGYLFSSIVASYQGEVSFVPSEVSDDLGILEIEMTGAKFIVNDGQHRAAGITAALKKNPDLGNESISVLFFPYESLERVQQMFSDLNRYVVKTPTALNILFDHRDPRAQVVLEAVQRVPVFKNLVDKEHISLSKRSTNLFTLVSLYEATTEFLLPQLNNKVLPDAILFKDQLELVVDFWNEVSNHIKDWSEVVNGSKTSETLRAETISTHSVILRAIGAIGGQLVSLYPKDWQKRLKVLDHIDWRKTNPEWLNVVIVSGSVISNSNSRIGAKEILRRKFSLPESVKEQVKEAEQVMDTKGEQKAKRKTAVRQNVGTRRASQAA